MAGRYQASANPEQMGQGEVVTNIIYKSSIYIAPVDSIKADRTIQDFRCSTCWSDLLKWPQPREVNHINLSLVLCIKCDEHTRGFVHKSTIDLKKLEDHFNAQEVKKAYPGLDPNPREKKSTEENIEDLGF